MRRLDLQERLPLRAIILVLERLTPNRLPGRSWGGEVGLSPEVAVTVWLGRWSTVIGVPASGGVGVLPRELTKSSWSGPLLMVIVVLIAYGKGGQD